MADRNDIRGLRTNEDWVASATITDDNDDPRDLTGASFEMDIRSSAAASETIATLTSGNGRIALSDDPTDGQVFLHLPQEEIEEIAPGNYVYDLRMQLDGNWEVLTWGSFQIAQGVSR
jgi:hypothetical protein